MVFKLNMLHRAVVLIVVCVSLILAVKEVLRVKDLLLIIGDDSLSFVFLRVVCSLVGGVTLHSLLLSICDRLLGFVILCVVCSLISGVTLRSLRAGRRWCLCGKFLDDTFKRLPGLVDLNTRGLSTCRGTSRGLLGLMSDTEFCTGLHVLLFRV